jgi:hypothetical protein
MAPANTDWRNRLRIHQLIFKEATIMKKILGILLLGVTLLSGITVLAATSGSAGTSMGAGDKHHHRHHRRWHRRHGGAMKNGNMKH